jgi:hypothetical protein
MLNVLLTVIMLSIIMLHRYVIMLTSVKLTVVILSFVMLHSGMVGVIMLFRHAGVTVAKCPYAECHQTECCGTLIMSDSCNVDFK